ncbi:60Kd inner membrane protein-domain-containing protein [Ustulina deusta]|nr:60Kd inner membrane protein-domain-containing protein [Ustulina deusta]
MLPSRGLARNPAAALRYSLSSRTKPTRTLSATLPTRQFSQAPSQSSVLSRRGLSRTNTAPYGQLAPSASTVGLGASAGIAASSVFAQRSGAARNLSLWPFQSKSPSPPTPETPETSETPAERPPEPPAEPQSPVVETSSLSSPPADPAATAADTLQLPDDLLRALDPQSFLDIPEHLGYLKELGLDYGFGPTSACQWLLESIYISSGLPWWGAIATVAALFRLVMFYPTLVAAKHTSKVQKAQSSPAYVKAKAEFQQAAYYTPDRAAMLYARSEMRRIMKTAGSSTWKPLVSFAMLPFSFGMFRLVRGMASLPVPGMETGGLAWFTDLTVHDPFFILPAVSVGLGSLLVVVRHPTAPPRLHLGLIR